MGSNPNLQLSLSLTGVFAKCCRILFNLALPSEGGQLEEPTTFVSDLNEMMIR